MAEEREELLARAKEIQRQKLLVKAKELKAQAEQKANGPMFVDDNRPLVERLKDIPKNVLSAELEAAQKIAGPVSSILDYPAGIGRTVSAAYLANAMEKPNVADLEDLENTLIGRAPGWAEYDKRLGMGPLNFKIPIINEEVEGRKGVGFLQDVATDPFLLGNELSRVLGKGANLLKDFRVAGPLVEDMGTSMYKSGMKKIDQQGARYGKKPVSDLLLENRVTGSAQEVQDAMDAIGKELEAAREKLLKNATSRGAEVNMDEAVARAQDVVDHMKKMDHPELGTAIGALQNRINLYRSRNAVNAEDIIRPLYAPTEEQVFTPKPENVSNVYVAPQTATIETSTSLPRVDAKGRPIVNFDPPRPGTGEITVKKRTNEPVVSADDAVVSNSLPVQGETKTVMQPGKTVVLDQTERIPGPTPIQTSSWKSTNNAGMPDNAWRVLAATGYGNQFDKALAGGLAEATENAVGRVGPEGAPRNPNFHSSWGDGRLPDAQKLRDINEKWGRILTSEEKAALEAEKEANKNAVTPVDALALTMGGLGPAATKKAADLAKTSAFRTNLGLFLRDVGQTGIPDALLRRGYIDEVSPNDALYPPWLRMRGQ